MLLTALEIIAFMVAAAIIGVVLGWVLRGTLGNEQTEIGDLRTQLRQLKKANRESKAALAAANEASSNAAVSAPAKAADSVPAKNPQVKTEEVKAKPEAAVVVETKKSATTKKAVAKKKTSSKAGKNASARKTLAEREADQLAGQTAFAEVVSRVGKSDADDKLTKLYGVGKKYATMLNDLGITSYEQISKLRKADVRTLAAALGVLDDRLETEDWVGGAKKLMKEAKK